jgi:hypothetical protein
MRWCLKIHPTGVLYGGALLKLARLSLTGENTFTDTTDIDFAVCRPGDYPGAARRELAASREFADVGQRFKDFTPPGGGNVVVRRGTAWQPGRATWRTQLLVKGGEGITNRRLDLINMCDQTFPSHRRFVEELSLTASIEGGRVRLGMWQDHEVKYLGPLDAEIGGRITEEAAMLYRTLARVQRGLFLVGLPRDSEAWRDTASAFYVRHLLKLLGSAGAGGAPRSTQWHGEWAQIGIGGRATDSYTSIAELLRFIVLTFMGQEGVTDTVRSIWRQLLHPPESYLGCFIRLTVDRTDAVIGARQPHARGRRMIGARQPDAHVTIVMPACGVIVGRLLRGSADRHAEIRTPSGVGLSSCQNPQRSAHTGRLPGSRPLA